MAFSKYKAKTIKSQINWLLILSRLKWLVNNRAISKLNECIGSNAGKWLDFDKVMFHSPYNFKGEREAILAS